MRYKIIMIFGALLASLVLLPSSALAVGEPRFERIPLSGDGQNASDNLSAVRGTIEDSYGFIWFAGENGLARFDGVDLIIYQNVPDDPTSISANFIWSLAVDQDGVLWVGTGQGLNRYRSETDDFARYLHQKDKKDSLSNNNVNTLAVDQDNNLVIGTAHGLSILNPERTRFTNYYMNPESGGNDSGDNYIRDVFVDRNNHIWVATRNEGLNRFDIDTGTFTAFKHDPQDPASINSNDVSSIEEDHQGRLWIGSYNHGLSRMNEDGETFTHYKHDPSDPSTIGSNNIGSILEDASNNLWVATDHGGLALYLPETDSFRRFTHSPYDIYSLSSNQPRHLYEDSRGNIWIGMFPTGVNFLDSSTSTISNYFHKPDDPSSLSSNAVLTIFEDSDGTFWIGTESGLNAFDPQSQSFTRYHADPNDPHALRFGSILTVEEDITGELWVGTWSGGAHRFNKETEKFFNYYPEEGDSDSLNNEFVWKILLDSDNTLWLATETGGLNRYIRETDSFEHYMADSDNPDSIISNQLWNMMEDSQGYLWVATLDGLSRLDKETGTFNHYLKDPDTPSTINSNQIISLHEHSDGRIWVGTRDAGVNIYNPETDDFSALGVSDGLPSATISSILEDNNGDIWLATVNGLAKVDPTTSEISIYNKSHGLASNNFNRDASFKDEDGNLYFGGVGGLSVFHPDDLTASSEPPPVVITDFRLFNQSVEIGGESRILTRSIIDTNEIDLNHDHSMFSFSFSALSYRAPQSNQYAYKLEGFDNDWIHIGNQRSATYTNLNPGTYVFRVKAANRDGVWNEEGASVVININPPLWRTWWAYIAYGVLAIAALYMINRYKSLKIKSNIYRTLSRTDPLTGIKNRAGLQPEADELFVRGQFGDPVGMLVIDIDHFKPVNDELGHDTGDRILKEFARLVTRSVRAGDHFARWGGEEFVLLCSGVNSDTITALAEKIRQMTESHVFDAESSALRITVSIGASCLVPGDSFDDVFKRADTALYKAKDAGRNRVVLAD